MVPNSTYVREIKISEGFVAQQDRYHDSITIILRVTTPLVNRFHRGQKIPRGKVEATGQAIVKELSSHPGVLSTDCQLVSNHRHSITMREAVVIRCAILSGEKISGSKPLLTTDVWDITIERTFISVMMHPGDFDIAEHVAIRYNSRSRNVADTAIGLPYGEIWRCMVVSTPLAIMAAMHQNPTGYMALPFGTGIVFGNIIVKEHNSFQTLDCTVSRKGGPKCHKVASIRQTTETSPTLGVLVKTYFDFETLTGINERLFWMLSKFAKDHEDFLPLYHQNHFYGDFYLGARLGVSKENIQEEITKRIGLIEEDALRLLNTPTWQQFVKKQEETGH